MTTQTTSGIPTTYQGTRFRSRLEARWAAFFDLVGWSWTYEPFDATGWIPDFLIRAGADSAAGGNRAVEGWSHLPLLIEVGPCDERQAFRAKAAKALAAFPGEDIDGIRAKPEWTTLVLGISPIVLDDTTAGYITDDGAGGGPDFAVWGQCQGCHTLCVTHRWMAYNHFPCGHYTGGDTGLPMPGRWLADKWADAGNRVQWRRR